MLLRFFKKPLPFLTTLLFYSFISFLLFHKPLLDYILKHGGGTGIVISVTIAYICTTNMVLATLSLLGNKCMQAVFAFLTLCNALAFYFIHTYHVFLTRAMMGNVFNTNAHEAGAFLGGNLWFYGLLGLGLAGLFYAIPIAKPKLKTQAGIFLGSALVFFIWSFTHAKQWLFLDHHAKNIGGLALPYSYSINAMRVALHAIQQSPPKLLENTPIHAHNTIVVLVIGESARRANYGIYGYPRATTPKLQKRMDNHEILALKATSCATYTTAALACMLAPKAGYENLPSFLHRQGVKVVWLSLNDAEPPMKIDWKPPLSLWQDWLKQKGIDPQILSFDEALALALPHVLERYPKDNVLIILHLKGSHGPLYVDKVPPHFAPFKPLCTHSEPNMCSVESLVNAYDNTIAYNDQVLDRMVDILQHSPKPALLLYMSDHGESLGEHGMYLHGTPYLIAPDFQKQVPFIVYANNAFKATHHFKPIKQDYQQSVIFSSILGAFGAQKPCNAYTPDLDIFKAHEEH